MQLKAFIFVGALLYNLIVISVLPAAESKVQSMQLTSSAFQAGAEIPPKYSCEGNDVSPEVSWRGAPAGTRTFALIADDPDAPSGTWVHWVIYDLPADAKGLAEGVPATEVLTNGAKQGVNDFRKIGYGGPCPPPGLPHRYFFKLYALDAPTGLKPRATKHQLLDAIKNHILGEAELIGRYKR